jgi:hypothetical protein
MERSLSLLLVPVQLYMPVYAKWSLSAVTLHDLLSRRVGRESATLPAWQFVCWFIWATVLHCTRRITATPQPQQLCLHLIQHHNDATTSDTNPNDASCLDVADKF